MVLLMSKKFLGCAIRDSPVAFITERDEGSGMCKQKREKYRDMKTEKGNKDFQGRMHF